MATIHETNTQKCDVGEVQAAIFDQRPLIEYEVNEKLETRPRYMLAKIPDGGPVDPHDDGTTLIMGKGFQAPVGYNDYNDPLAPECRVAEGIDGYQEAQGDCGASTVRFGATINETEKDQCNGVCIVDFAQGYRFRGSDDFSLELATPERCIETLAKKERRFVAQYLEQEIESFSETAFQSFDHHLVSTAIERGGANSVVKSYQNGLPVLTEGGWQVGNNPESDVKHITFWFCKHYRRQIVQRLRQFGKGENAENYVAEFEVTRDAYEEMMINESLERTGDGGYIAGRGAQVRINEEIFEKSHRMRGKAFGMSPDGTCRFIFNDEPIRGFLQPTGTTADGQVTYDFIRIYHLRNRPDEEMGVRAVYNPEYDYNCITCGGVSYPLMELIPHIHDESFKRHGLTKGIGPRGVNAVGNNFEIQLLQKDALSSGDCPNFFQNKYRYAARHKYRWRDIYPELSGFILHRRRILKGYDICADDDCYTVKDGLTNASPEDIDNCNEERCDNGCPVEECNPKLDIVTLEPCGEVNTAFCGTSHIVTLNVCRPDACPETAAKVEYAVNDGTAIAGTHYQVVDAEGNALPAAGLVEWEAGESGCKEICIEILAALEDTPADMDKCCNEIEPVENLATFDVCLASPSGTALGDCFKSVVNIQNRA